MRSEKLQDAIGLIKDEYILEAHGYESSGSAEAAAEAEDSRAGQSGFKTGTVLAGDFRPGRGQSKDALSVEAKERKDAGRNGCFW